MKLQNLSLGGAALIEAEPFSDHRGTFARFFCADELKGLFGNRQIVNVNYSRTAMKGAVRGMHFQYPPKAEMKFIRCIRGSVYDVIVDIRKDSPTFLQWFGAVLSEENMQMLCVPEGFAHGFQALEEGVEMLYLHTEFYSPEHEGGLLYNDPVLGIKWPLLPTDISERDKQHRAIDEIFNGVEI